MIPDSEKALVENAVHGYPTRELMRARSKTWTFEHFEYALSRVETLTEVVAQNSTTAYLESLRTDHIRAEAEEKERSRHVATETALAELRRAVERGPKPHWTQTPSFWIALIAAVAAVVAAWPVVRDWLR